VEFNLLSGASKNISRCELDFGSRIISNGAAPVPTTVTGPRTLFLEVSFQYVKYFFSLNGRRCSCTVFQISVFGAEFLKSRRRTSVVFGLVSKTPTLCTVDWFDLLLF